MRYVYHTYKGTCIDHSLPVVLLSGLLLMLAPAACLLVTDEA